MLFWKSQVDVILKIIKNYKNNPGNMLDFGSGSGNITKELKRRGCNNSFIDCLDAQAQFKDWIYKDNQTHVNFFCNKALFKFAELAGYFVYSYEDSRLFFYDFGFKKYLYFLLFLEFSLFFYIC